MRRDPEGAFDAVPALQFRRRFRLGPALPVCMLEPNHLLAPLLEHVGAALQEEHPENVFLELGCIHLPAQDVGGFEEVPLELREGQWQRRAPIIVSPGWMAGAWRWKCWRSVRRICRFAPACILAGGLSRTT
jgi:hypothetical protein